MRNHIIRYCKQCPTCQFNKKKFKKYGHLPEKIAECVPWDVLCVDSIGPYKIRTGPKKTDVITVQCITMIDPATSWFEICEKSDKTGMTSANIVEQQWLSRYPWPTQVICDRGTEFNNQEFKEMLKNDYGVTTKVISVRNPQANSIIERVHQVLGNMIRTFELEKNYIDEDDPWSGIFSAAAFAIRSTYHTTLKSTPGQLVFGRDMILNATHEANWEYIRKRKQQIIAKNNKAENAKRIPYTYSVGDKVLLRRGSDHKYETPYKGPYTILKVNDNGTVRIRVRNVEDTYNIRQITPYQSE
jgi:transposase InsO family protein